MRNMASLLHRLWKGETGGSSAGSAAGHPEQPKREEPLALPPPPQALDMDTMGGEVTVTYETLTGKTPRHFTKIYLDPGYLPTIPTGSKPDNNNYLAVKHDLLSKAYHALKPYVDFVLSLKGMADRDDLRRGLEIVLKRFLARYWDMPASKSHHHAYPWGLVLHCMYVACAEAEKATAWTPMSEHGIDEINQARYLGIIVLLHFTRGLLHDSYKIYQLNMTAILGGTTIKFDPLRDKGNVLDFKIIYSLRTEDWGDSIAGPAKLNAIEFLGLFPKELVRYTPSSQFLAVITDILDMEGMDSDRESAKQDISKAGLFTVEKMVQDAIRAYFANPETTKPENNVFRVNNEWIAVNGNQFFLKVRTFDGGIYTKDGVKKFLLQEGALSHVDNRTDTSLHYKIVMPNGTATRSKSASKISFIRTEYLEEACSEFSGKIGHVFFAENDRDAVLELCPSADNFLRSLDIQPDEKKAEKASEKPAESGETNVQPENEAPPVTSNPVATTDSQQDEPVAEVMPVQQPESDETERPVNQPEAGQAPKPAVIRPALKPLVGCSKQLLWRFENYRPGDSCPDTGWLFVGIRSVHVRPPQFYMAVTNDGLLDEPDWGQVAANICRQLRDEKLLVPQPVTGTIDYTPPGGGDASIDGSFFQLTLHWKMHGDLLDRVCKSASLAEGG